jgi:5-methylcytosine-specific restriction endonuclease McrA
MPVAYSVKTCQRCGKEYEPKSSMQKWCLECRTVAVAEKCRVYQQKLRDKGPHGFKLKTCQRCGHEYQPTTGNQKYCLDCKSLAAKEHLAAKYAMNRDERIAKVRKYAAAHKEKISIRHHTYHKEYAVTHKTELAMRQQIWDRANPEKCRLHCSKRRALKYDNTPINELLTETQWQTLLAKYDGHCAYCGKEVKLTLDHVIPLSKGGKHSIDNVVPACLHCNDSKGARTPEQWLQSLITGHGSDALQSVRAAGPCTGRRMTWKK